MSIVLKTIINDVVRDVKNDRKIDVDVKGTKVRATLRRDEKIVALCGHAHNASWTFDNKSRDIVYDKVRLMYDAKYAEDIEQRANERKAQRAQRKASSSKAKNTETIDA